MGHLGEDKDPTVIVSHLDIASLSLLPIGTRRTLGPPISLFQAPPANQINLVDLDKDGDLDLVLELANNQSFSLAWRPYDNGVFTPHKDLLMEGFESNLWSVWNSSLIIRDDRGLVETHLDSNGLLRKTDVLFSFPESVSVASLRSWDLDEDGTEEIYMTLSFPGEPRQLVRWAPKTGGCNLTEVEEANDIGDWNQDGIPDLLYSRTCTRCTSNPHLTNGDALIVYLQPPNHPVGKNPKALPTPAP